MIKKWDLEPKTKLKWEKEWDNNTKLFHSFASGRRLNNFLNKLLELDDGSLLESKSGTKLLAFKKNSIPERKG